MTLKELQGKQYSPMHHGKATDALANLHIGDVKKDSITKETSISVRDLNITLEDKTSGICYVSMHKLLSVASMLLCSQNITGSDNCGRTDYEVVIPLRAYAILCGCNIREDEAVSEAEKKREHNVIKDVRKKVDRDLNVLLALVLSWTEEKAEKEKKKNKIVNYMDMHMISAKGIVNGNIIIDFTPDFADYLTSLPITQYPLALLKIDERNRNAYSIGLQMTEHANMPSNIKMKTANLLKVSTLLKYTNLPSRETGSVKKVGWRKRIREPFENALEALMRCGLLQMWEYTRSKGVPLTDEEEGIETFEEWNNMLVHFVLTDQPDYTNRTDKESNTHPEEKLEGDVTVGNRGMLL